MITTNKFELDIVVLGEQDQELSKAKVTLPDDNDGEEGPKVHLSVIVQQGKVALRITTLGPQFAAIPGEGFWDAATRTGADIDAGVVRLIALAHGTKRALRYLEVVYTLPTPAQLLIPAHIASVVAQTIADAEEQFGTASRREVAS